jgi:hypothetical protein
MEYQLGMTLKQGDKEVVVVRIVDSSSIFTDRETNLTYVIKELYLELLSARGEISFLSINETRDEIVKDPNIKIMYPDTLEWRKLVLRG